MPIFTSFTFISISIAMLTLLPSSLSGQALNATDPLPAERTDCFEHYRFGSVQAKLTTNVSSTTSGAPVTFSGSIENANDFPIIDGALYVKIFHVRSTEKDANGPDVVDQFLVRSDLIIPARGSVPVTFSWQVPAFAATGNYKAATFFTTSRKFNLLGLSFTDDVVGNTVPFKVTGETTDGVRFDKSSVTVDGRPYYFAAFPPRLDKARPINIAVRAANTSPTDEVVSVSWSVYQWDAQLAENLVEVQESSTAVKVPANGTLPVSFTVRDARFPVYLVVGTITWRDSKSIIGVRFARDSIDRARINFPGLASFPLRQGKQVQLFSCLHNAGSSDAVPETELLLTLSDKDGTVIHEARYAGDVSSAMMGVKSAFMPSKDYNHVLLDARLYVAGEFVDEAYLEYDCRAIDPRLCTAEGDELPAHPLDQTYVDQLIATVAASGVLVILMVLIAYAMIRRYRRRATPR